MYYHLPLKKCVVIHINKHFSNTHECVVPGVVEIGQEAWRRNLNVINVFSLCHYYHPLEKDVALHLNKLEFQ